MRCKVYIIHHQRQNVEQYHNEKIKKSEAMKKKKNKSNSHTPLTILL